ncbi:MAG TPA: 50S ribosomal protein L20 [Candidatus Saccharimonadia bacterium]|nr:50S ribosomal protein L20 [Candidatus Saccharimonadia bacterium]
MRVKRGVTTHAKHKKLRQQTKGYSLIRRSSIKMARQAVIKALQYQYRDRRNKKRDLRGLWITRISAAAKLAGTSYSALMGSLKKANITLDRKILAELTVSQPKAFEAVVAAAKAAK